MVKLYAVLKHSLVLHLNQAKNIRVILRPWYVCYIVQYAHWVRLVLLLLKKGVTFIMNDAAAAAARW